MYCEWLSSTHYLQLSHMSLCWRCHLWTSVPLSLSYKYIVCWDRVFLQHIFDIFGSTSGRHNCFQIIARLWLLLHSHYCSILSLPIPNIFIFIKQKGNFCQHQDYISGKAGQQITPTPDARGRQHFLSWNRKRRAFKPHKGFFLFKIDHFVCVKKVLTYSECWFKTNWQPLQSWLKIATEDVPDHLWSSRSKLSCLRHKVSDDPCSQSVLCCHLLPPFTPIL